MLQFRSSYGAEPYPFIEITVEERQVNGAIFILVEDSENLVWQTELDRGEIIKQDFGIKKYRAQKDVSRRLPGPSQCGRDSLSDLFGNIKISPSPWEMEGGPSHISVSGKHFVDKHRVDLIRGIYLVDPILQELYSLDLLTNDQCDTIYKKPTSQEQMRELYCYVTHWGNDDKDKVYRILKKHNRPVIKKMEREDC
ncbi:apoptosis-associated speck-like protein containing a CARD [Pyxicephalus adspersus]|uniref:apoptosis-associated speck-like protein containing a CARD n=1 Tax=Pyxicephalus adspersus TaxID=30357 RepID=UPI003B5B13D5